MIRIGAFMIAASGFIWLGAELTRRVEWILSYTAGVGVLLLLIGMSNEVRKYRQAYLDPGAPGKKNALRSPSGNPDR